MILFVQKSLENWKYFYSLLRKKIFKEFDQPLRFLKDFPNYLSMSLVSHYCWVYVMQLIMWVLDIPLGDWCQLWPFIFDGRHAGWAHGKHDYVMLAELPRLFSRCRYVTQSRYRPETNNPGSLLIVVEQIRWQILAERTVRWRWKACSGRSRLWVNFFFLYDTCLKKIQYSFQVTPGCFLTATCIHVTHIRMARALPVPKLSIQALVEPNR
jgi:hypothetical protein